MTTPRAATGGLIIPDLYLIGVPKAGTTSLARWLTDHPDVDGGTEKEPRVLMDADDPLARENGYHKRGLEAFSAYFPAPDAPVSWTLDGSPEYYYQQTALDVLASRPEARAIFVLREPAERIRSMFRFAKYNIGVLPRDPSFGGFLNEVDKGRDSALIGHRLMLRDSILHGEYARYIRAWSQALGNERVKVVIFEEMKADPKATLVLLAEWLSLSTAFYDDYGFSVKNDTYATRNATLHKIKRQLNRVLPAGLVSTLAPLYRRINTKPVTEVPADPSDAAARDRLRAHFEPWNEELRLLLGRRNPIW